MLNVLHARTSLLLATKLLFFAKARPDMAHYTNHATQLTAMDTLVHVVVNNKCQPVAVWPNFAQPIHWVKTKSKVPPMLTRHRLKEALVAAKTTSKSLLYHNDLRMWISWKQQIILWFHQHPLIANVVSYIRRSSVFVISLYFSFILTGYVINICMDI